MKIILSKIKLVIERLNEIVLQVKHLDSAQQALPVTAVIMGLSCTEDAHEC